MSEVSTARAPKASLMSWLLNRGNKHSKKKSVLQETVNKTRGAVDKIPDQQATSVAVGSASRSKSKKKSSQVPGLDTTGQFLAVPGAANAGDSPVSRGHTSYSFMSWVYNKSKIVEKVDDNDSSDSELDVEELPVALLPEGTYSAKKWEDSDSLERETANSVAKHGASASTEAAPPTVSPALLATTSGSETSNRSSAGGRGLNMMIDAEGSLNQRLHGLAFDQSIKKPTPADSLRSEDSASEGGTRVRHTGRRPSRAPFEEESSTDEEPSPSERKSVSSSGVSKTHSATITRPSKCEVLTQFLGNSLLNILAIDLIKHVAHVRCSFLGDVAGSLALQAIFYIAQSGRSEGTERIKRALTWAGRASLGAGGVALLFAQRQSSVALKVVDGIVLTVLYKASSTFANLAGRGFSLMSRDSTSDI